MQSVLPAHAAQLTRATFFRGRVAMAAALSRLGVGRGDDVAIQAFTCIAVPEAVLSVGARPVYADVGRDSVNMDPASLDAALTPRTKAIVVQHTFGIPADMTRIMAIAEGRGLPVIEDCAHALGSDIQGKAVGTFGKAAFYSYEAGKPLVLGLGGSAIAADAQLQRDLEATAQGYDEPARFTQLQIAAMRTAYRLSYRPETYWWVRDTFRAMTKLGVVRGNYTYHYDESQPSPDFRRRMGAVQRRALARGLDALPALLTHRETVSSGYRAGITSPRLSHVPLLPGTRAVHGRYPLLADDKRATLAAARRARVELAEFYNTPIHPLTGESLKAVAYTSGQCPNAENVAGRIVTLPTNEYVTEAFVARAVRTLNAT